MTNGQFNQKSLDLTLMMLRFTLLLCCFCWTCSAPESSDSPSPEPLVKTVPSRLGLIHEMQGRWKDGRIKGGVVLITGERFVSIYQGELMAEARLEVFEECPTSCRAAWEDQGQPSAKGFFILHRESGPECYLLEKLEFEELRYRLLALAEQ